MLRYEASRSLRQNMRVNEKSYYVYILTNKIKTVLYTGMTNALEQRLIEHFIDRIERKTFTGKYNCHFLIYYERYRYVNDAITREKEIKGWLRIKKEALIQTFNPEWKFLNEELLGEWPPSNIFHRK